jgi:hypothetical protein
MYVGGLALSVMMVAGVAAVVIALALLVPARTHDPLPMAWWLLPLHVFTGMMVVLISGSFIDRHAPGLLYPIRTWELLPFGVVYVVGCVLTYAVQLRQRHTWPAEEPCQNSGTLLGLHWFDFASLPGARLWTRDGRLAAAIRRRGGGSWDPVDEAVDDRPGHHVQAAQRTVGMVGVGVAAAAATRMMHLLMLDAYIFTTPLAKGWAWALAGAAALTSVSLHILVSVPVFAVAWMAWNRLLRPSRDSATVEQGALVAGGRRVHLGAPDRHVDLTHDAFGARLTVTAAGQRVDVHGRHVDLAPLVGLLTAQPRESAADREVMLARLREALVARGGARS